MTVKVVGLGAIPPAVVMPMSPSFFAPVGTVAVTCESESTVKAVAFMPSKVTFVVCMRLFPVIVTGVPTGPVEGVKLRICGVTRIAGCSSACRCVLAGEPGYGVISYTEPNVSLPSPLVIP